MGPIWVQWVFSVACLAVGGYYAAMLLARKSESGAGRVGADESGGEYGLSHLAMALGMAAMFSPIDDPVPRLLWILVFGMVAAWFASRAVRTGLRAGATAHHLVAGLAMLFMLVTAHGHGTSAAAEVSGHAGHLSAAGGGGSLTGPLGTVLTVLLGGYFAVHAGRALRLLLAPHPPSAAPGETAGTGPVAVVRERRGWAPSRVAAGCHVVMGTAMAVMFGLMLAP